ncbi:elongation factor Ts [Vulcanimicrobium alpinum]|uniref:Elongation factor Ts n=1 Tax=Vulcanimicrobium alpinum TaxID=3016050 RepID=A0AAN2C982_UNVUL|nr:translation elongation factor Ts [Vulcanimicrobium alpinum]BDE06270.1 elongation factor Ts [Vulcanimicrobium alpinum]
METTAYKPSADEIKRLREETGAGMSDVRNALVWANGDMERAKARLGELGQAKAEKKAERSANEGLVGSYIHAGGKIGVLVEINCETDFVARNERFRDLVRDVAMHVAAMSPQYLDRDAVPADVAASVQAELEKTVPPGKPADIVEKIVSGKLNKWFEEHTLLEQPFVKDDSQTVGELVNSVSGILGEKIKVRRYVKFALGEE